MAVLAFVLTFTPPLYAGVALGESTRFISEIKMGSSPIAGTTRGERG